MHAGGHRFDPDRLHHFSEKYFASASSSEFKEVGFLDAKLKINLRSSLVPASTSRFEEVRFLGTKLQRSELKAVASFLEN